MFNKQFANRTESVGTNVLDFQSFIRDRVLFRQKSEKKVTKSIYEIFYFIPPPFYLEYNKDILV